LYCGDPEAECGVVPMGSAAMSSEEVVDYLRKHGEMIGILNARCIRPFSYKLFEFYGDPEAVRVMVLMCSEAKMAQEVVDYIRKHG
jgi:pyruvate/2-oxoacid:ferredoxin oxidoreductase alpha subunit